VKGMLPEIGTALLSGQWGLYKSFTLFDLGVSLITGNNFAGYRVKRRGGMMVFAAEGAFDISNRLEGLAQCGKLPPEPQPFAWKATFPSLLQAGAYAELERMVAEVEKQMLARWGMPLVSIAVDTMAAAAGFRDEQDNAEGQRVMNVLSQLAKRFKCCTIAVDHFGKDASTGTRGASAKEAVADAVLALLGDRAQSGKVSNSRLAIRKLRNGETGKEIRFDTRVLQLGTDEDGDPITTRVIEWKTSGEATTAKKPRWTTTLEPLRKALTTAVIEQGRPLRPFGQEGQVVQAVDRDILRAEFFKWVKVDSDTEEKKADARRKKFERAVSSAAAVGLIGLFKEMAWLILPGDESAVVNLQQNDSSEYGTGIASDPAPGAGAGPN
jgi:hypothetical protein